MAIQEIESAQVHTKHGVARGIDENAIGLMMDIVQSTQYQYPIESCVREITANAIDSVTERNRAVDILGGNSNVSDFFVERSEALYKDSKWDPSYYDAKYFSDNNVVTITYKERDGVGRCNSLIIRDEGVGLGKERLFGVLGVGWSTKRLRKDTLGSFGLGSKSGLATGADYYIIRSAHNGLLAEIRVYNRKYQSMFGPINLLTSKPNIKNIKITETGEEIIYCQEYEGTNFTEFEIPVLKSTKEQYVDACKKQLLYMQDVDLVIEDEYNNRRPIQITSEPFYNSANIIMNNNSYYGKPHVVVVKGDMESLTGMCYGFLDFDEMESQPLSGNIGIKCPIRQVTVDEDGNEVVINEGISVTPSRESIRYTPETIAFINSQFAKAQEEATALIEERLSTTDFNDWLDACRNMSYSAGGDSVLKRLKNICDLDKVRPMFKGKSKATILFSNDVSLFFAGYKVLKHTKTKDKDGKIVSSRDDVIFWSDIDLTRLYLRKGNNSRAKDLYLIEHLGVFCTIHQSEDPITSKDLGGVSVEVLQQTKKQSVELKDLLLKDLKSYDDVEVSEDFNIDAYDTSHRATTKQFTPEESRALNAQTVARSFKYDYDEGRSGKMYCFDKVEPQIRELANLQENEELYYGTEEDLHLFYTSLVFVKSRNNPFWNQNLKIACVAKNNLKYFKVAGKHISEYLVKKEYEKEGDLLTGYFHLTTHQHIIDWNTARLLLDNIRSIPFMSNMRVFNEDMTLLYHEIKDYVDEHYKNVQYFVHKNREGITQNYPGLLATLENAYKIQLQVEAGATREEIIEEFGEDGGVISAKVVESDMINKLDTLLGYANPYKDMLNNINELTKYKGYPISQTLEHTIREYLQLKQ